MRLRIKGAVRGMRYACTAILSDVRNISHLGDWVRAYRSGSPIDDRRPWMTFLAIDRLEKIVEPGMRVFEYGTGGSTIWFMSKGVDLVSVEHDDTWSGRVIEKLQSEGLKCDYRLVKPELKPVDQITAGSTRGAPENADFQRYVDAIAEFDEQTFDLVSIDGRSRVACATVAKSRVRPGGYLVLDNSERSDYLPIFQMLEGWERWDYSGFGPYAMELWQTTIWRRPQ